MKLHEYLNKMHALDVAVAELKDIMRTLPQDGQEYRLALRLMQRINGKAYMYNRCVNAQMFACNRRSERYKFTRPSDGRTW